MAMFLISYNLEFPEENNKAVQALLRKLGATLVLDSLWMVRKESSVEALTDAMYRAVSLNDRLVVAEMTAFQIFEPIEDVARL